MHAQTIGPLRDHQRRDNCRRRDRVADRRQYHQRLLNWQLDMKFQTIRNPALLLSNNSYSVRM